jgi:hypothetical protein
MRQLSITKVHSDDQWNLRAVIRRRNAGQHPRHLLRVDENIVSFTSWFSPTIREIGFTEVSGGIVEIKSRTDDVNTV